MEKKKQKAIKTGLITVIAGSQLFTLAPITILAEENKIVEEGKENKNTDQIESTVGSTEENKTVEEGKENKNTDQAEPTAGSTEENKTVEEGKEIKNTDQLKPTTGSVEENKTIENDEERGVNWAYEGKIEKHERVPFNQSTRQDGKLNLKYVAKVKLGTQLFETSNVLLKLPDTIKDIFKQSEEKGYDFRKYISASVKYPDSLGSGIFYKTKKYDWNEIEYKFGDTVVLKVPKASFWLFGSFTTDITFNYGDLIRDADIVPNKSNFDEMDLTWTTNIIDWTVIGSKKTNVDVNPLIIGEAMEKPKINAKDKVIKVGDKFDPLEDVTATDMQGNPIKVVVESNTVDSSKPGVYAVIYSATDKFGNKTEKTIMVTVKEKDPTEKPTIYAENKTINVGDEFDPKKGVFAIDSEGHVLDVNVVANTVNPNEPGSYIVIYSATDKYGNRAEKHITVTVKAKNPTEKPTIYAENKTINVGDKFDPKEGVYAIDSEGRLIQVDVVVNTVDTKQPGSYIVVYSATDKYGNKAEKHITVTVKAKDPTEKPTIYAENKTINVGDKFDPKEGVYAIDSEGSVVQVDVEINTVNPNEPGIYIVKYSATDKYGNKAEKYIQITVKSN
ncbi:immunoglobulin-like domain-containing protein [Bacillus cereus]|uniref:immunoglobulin-like domain-containing protein n=1 Tax=Bacillus cereus TaxID=1396 RepID=UPI0015967994|nr:immunoglobulin-like domain-containing protein [Bacillus cereus]